MAAVRVYSDEELCEHIQYELKYGRQLRRRLRVEWQIAEYIYQGIISKALEGGLDSDQAIASFLNDKVKSMEGAVINSTHLVRAMVFLHSKLAIVEPDVVTRAFTREWPDKKAANIAQLVIEHIKATADIQDVLETGPYLSLVKKGTGVTYQGFDEDAGEVRSIIRNGQEINVEDYEEGQFSIQPETDTLKMTGDFVFRNVNCENFFIDSTATRFEDALSCIEEMWMPVVKFKYMINNLVDSGKLDQKKADDVFDWLTKLRDGNDVNQIDSSDKRRSNASIPVYYYWERAMPWNGMLGTFCFFVENALQSGDDNTPGEIILLERSEHPYDHKQLPYAICTDLPIEDSPFGMSRAVHASHLHDMINQLYSMIMDNVELHGAVYLVKPEDSTNNAVESTKREKVLTYNPASGGQVYHLKPSNVATDVWKVIDEFKKEIDAFYGQGEFSRGEIPRELSSYAVQLGIEMDDKYRILLFNSKKKMLRRIYRQFLALAQQYVTESRMLKLVGSEFAYMEPYFKGADLVGNYDVEVQFGKYMPVDPSARKQMVLELINNGAFEKAGGNVKKLFKILLDGDMFDIVEVFEQAKRVQEAELNYLLEGQEVPIQEWQEHSAHKEALEDFMQSMFFEKLDENIQAVVFKHYEDHVKRDAELTAAARKAAETNAPPTTVNPNQMTTPEAGVPIEQGGTGMVPAA